MQKGVTQSIEKMWTMKVGTSNRKFLQTICEKDESYNSAITKLIEVAKPYLKKERIS